MEGAQVSAKFTKHLLLDACPHCGRANPTLTQILAPFKSNNMEENFAQFWSAYICASCGSVTTAYGVPHGNHGPHQIDVLQTFPGAPAAHSELPDDARRYLDQAYNSRHAPDGAVLLCASAVDAMLKNKKYLDGSLYSRIDKAVADHLLTEDMGKWAHAVRLDANDVRHADEKRSHFTEADAKRAIEFVDALAMFIFVLPNRVKAGLKDAGQGDEKNGPAEAGPE